MSSACCAPAAASERSNGWRMALWVALLLNGSMFVVEIYAGAAAESRALMADALDFFGDAANYAISLAVAGLALSWRAKAAMFKGISLVVLGIFVLGIALYSAVVGSSPEPRAMGIVGTLALLVNFGVAAVLYRFRSGDSDMRSVWICSRNDAVGNVAVVAAAAGVFGTGTAWPDLAVAVILASLGISGGVQIIRHARRDLRQPLTVAVSQ